MKKIQKDQYQKGSITIVFAILITILLLSVAIVSTISISYSLEVKKQRKNANEFALSQDALSVYQEALIEISKTEVSDSNNMNGLFEALKTNITKKTFYSCLTNEVFSIEDISYDSTLCVFSYSIHNDYIHKKINVSMELATKNISSTNGTMVIYDFQIIDWRMTSL